MKIAVASSGLGHVARGIETWALSLAKALAERDVRVTLFSGADAREQMTEVGSTHSAKNDEHPPVRICVLPCLKRGGSAARQLAALSPSFAWRWGMKSAYGWEQLSFWWRLWIVLRREEFDILHVQDPIVADWCRRFRERGLVKTEVILANGTEEELSFLEKFRYVQELSPRYLNRHQKPWRDGFYRWAIPNFVDTTVFCPSDQADCRRRFGLSTDAFVVLSAGAMNRERKRMEWLIDEVTAVESGNVVLAIAGVIEDEKGKGLVDEARVKLGSRFLFLDRVPHSDMPTAYGAADLFALCSTAEILGIAFLESMASGIPCIGHCFPVTEWVIGSGGTCIDMLGKGILAAEIDKYAANGMLRKERGAAARKRVEKMFSKDVVTDQILAMYGEVAKEHTCQCHHSCS